MSKYILNVPPGSDITVAHRKAVNATMGEIIESFQYDEKTGEVLVSTRLVPGFPDLPEGELSKELQKAIQDYKSQDAVLRQRGRDLDKREADTLRAERKLVENALEHGRNLKQLEGERIQFERDKGEVIKMGAFAGLKSFFHRIK